MNQLREWYEGLAPRERVMVTAAAVVVGIALFYYMLWSPLNSALADARAQVTAQANEARWMLGVRNEAQALRAAGAAHQPTGQNESLLSIVDTTSRANQLGGAVTQIQPQNEDKAIVSLENAGFDQMMYWLNTLQSKYGITVSEATVSRDNETAGEVDARLTLLRGAA